MKTKVRQVVLVLCAVMLVVGTLVGCNMLNPQKKPDNTPPAPQKSIQGNEPTITVYMHETGEKKSMKMEEYIAGVVAGEMKNDWPEEALAAQAIIARTFTMKKMDEGGVQKRGTQASTDIKEFQAYDAKAINDKVKKAVEVTRGKVITYEGKPINAWFHASAGGKTATAKEGLNYKEMEPPYIQSINSPDDNAPDDVKNWTATYTKAEMMQIFEKLNHPVNTIDTIEIEEKGPSGRATVFKVNNEITVSGPELRVNADSTKLKSMLLDKVEVSGDKIMFTGKGYGHGVGMSQWGAYSMAKGGKKAENIINYYFKNVTIEKRY